MLTSHTWSSKNLGVFITKPNRQSTNKISCQVDRNVSCIHSQTCPKTLQGMPNTSKLLPSSTFDGFFSSNLQLLHVIKYKLILWNCTVLHSKLPSLSNWWGRKKKRPSHPCWNLICQSEIVINYSDSYFNNVSTKISVVLPHRLSFPLGQHLTFKFYPIKY